MKKAIHGYYCPITRETYYPTVDKSRCGQYYHVSNISFPEYQGYFNAVVDTDTNALLFVHQYAHIGAYNREMFKDVNHVCWKKIQETVKELLDNK